MRRLAKDDVLLIIDAMFSYIGKDFNREECEFDSEWFLKHTWTSTQQEGFRKWLVKHLQKEFKQPKVMAEAGSHWLLLNYGFKIEDN